MKNKFVDFFSANFPKGDIHLHEPVFEGKEMDFISDAIHTTFVSSIGKYVDQVEKDLPSFIGSKYGIACVNGTSGLHLALLSVGVGVGDEVLTQAFSFVATSNAISYTGAVPIFLDIDKNTLGLSSIEIEKFIENHTKQVDGYRINKHSGRVIKACMPMNTFGIPSELDKISQVCEKYNIVLIEDAAESFGSKLKEKYTGTFGKIGVFSFNGNKIITAGGGGLLVTNDEVLAKKSSISRHRQNHSRQGLIFTMILLGIIIQCLISMLPCC